MRKLSVGLLVVTLGCQADATGPVVQPVVTVTVINKLVLPVTINANGTNLGAIPVSGSTVLTLPPGTTSILWTPNIRVLSDGSTIPSALANVSVNIAANLNTIDISNIANGSVWIAPSIVNTSGQRRWIGVWNGTTVSCLFYFDHLNTVGMSYLRLTSNTEIRSFAGSNCSGDWRSWTNSQLQNFQINSGYIALNANA
jgi:hypothetical protein